MKKPKLFIVKYFCLNLYLLFDKCKVNMGKCFFTRQEIADELGIDPKTFRRRLQEEGIVLEKGLIPAEKVREIKARLKVAPGMPDNKSDQIST